MEAETRESPPAPFGFPRSWGAGPLVAAGMAAGAGVFGGRLAPGLALPLTLGAVGSLAAAGVLRRRPAAVAAAVTAVGLAAASNGAWRMNVGLTERLAAQETFVEACGTVLAERHRSVEVELRWLRVRESAWQLRETVLVVGDKARALRAGERLCAEGIVRFPAQASGDPPPTTWDRALSRGPPVFLAVRDVQRRGVASPLRWSASVVRHRFRASATAALPDDRAGLLLGMTTGDRTLLDEQTVEAFRTTGLAHLVAVSGFHVAVVLGLVTALVRLLIPRGRWLRAAAVAPPLVFFAFLVGLTPSVLRATVMAGIVLAVVASGRTGEGLRTLSGAFIALVFASPDLLLRPGFQMSFGATVGLILWARPLSDRLAALWLRPASRLARATGALAGTALAAQLGVAPLLALHFGQVPAAGGLANLIAVPLAPVVVGGGLLALGAASLWDGLSWAPSLLLLPIDVILATARRFAALPGASFDAGVPAAAALTLGAAAILARSQKARALAAALAVLFAAAGVGRVAAVRLFACPGAEIRAVDVGGTAVLLRAGGATVLGDGGPREGDIVRELRALGVGRIDVIVASHPHADHTEGLEEVLRSVQVGAVLAPGSIGWGTGRHLVAAAREAGVPVIEATAGRSFRLGPKLGLEVLSPNPGPLPEEDATLINRYNLVVRADVDGTQVVLPGDADSLAQILLDQHTLGADVLVAVHHGSADLEAGFVEAVDPELTLVTVGRGNRYGHPKPQALEIYERHGPVFRTDTDGHVVVCTNGGTLEVRTQRVAPRTQAAASTLSLSCPTLGGGQASQG